jgi:hypothetical protein
VPRSLQVAVVLEPPDNYPRGEADSIRKLHDILAVEASLADQGIVLRARDENVNRKSNDNGVSPSSLFYPRGKRNCS